MKPFATLALSITLSLCLVATAVGSDDGAPLRSPADFESIADDGERSRALYLEASRVLTHARCVNCHPSSDRPLQADGVPHEPPVVRGASGHGVVGMRCNTCHQRANFDPGKIPGAPHWHLAPRSMAWEGLSAGEICRQIQDPERNGGRELEAVVAHMTEDPLVLWAWDPGDGREPAPGTPESFGRLIRAWAKTGAECPD